MKPTRLKIRLPCPEAKSYPILVGRGVLREIPKIIKKIKGIHRVVIITDDRVKELYGKKILNILKSSKGEDLDPRLQVVDFPHGEASKNEATKQKLDHALLSNGCGRDTLILALGGGVTGDLAGFVAATYMRGIPYIQIPTTLLSMVDSSIGGKVGVDTPHGKNLIGAFWHPEAVIADTVCLTTLPKEHLINGVIEAAKIFLTSDAEYFNFLFKNLRKVLEKDPRVLQRIIRRAIELKAGVVEHDEHEENERMILNFGHTIGHALEKLSGYTLLHGHAVALGVLVESRISLELGILPAGDFEIIRKFLKNLKIKESELRAFRPDAILEATRTDKKIRTGKTRYVLLERVGKVKKDRGSFACEIDTNIVKKAMEYFKN